MPNILALPGSLRSSSSSNVVLHAIKQMMPGDVSFEIYDGIGNLPHFNDAAEVPDEVLKFRNKVRQANAILICTPEYAFGIPGSLKNALDWTVSSGEFMNKPVALVTASSQGEKGHAALLQVLTAISAKIIPDATLLISFVRSRLDNNGNIKDHEVHQGLQKVVHSLVDGLSAEQ